MDIHSLKRELIRFFREQDDFVAEMSSEEVTPYFDEKTVALLVEMRRTLEEGRHVCERRGVTLEEMRDAFAAFKRCVERVEEEALPWIRSMRMPH